MSQRRKDGTILANQLPIIISSSGMKHRILILLFFLIGTASINAQITLSADLFEEASLTVKATVVDSQTGSPVSYASVYLIPDKDTVITHFTFSDSTGTVVMPEVMKGSYTFNVEILGYFPFKQQVTFKSGKEDIGIVKLDPNVESLQSAKVTAIANPIVVKRDTLEYNVSSFMISNNETLGDVLKNMTGIEVSDDGNVSVNGKMVSEITVNGRTFFFDNKKAALDNLPAQIVDKVKVIDKKTDANQLSGLAQQDKERVMDVVLKKEYTEGWFGNTEAQGGSTLSKKDDGGLTDDRGFLYNANALVAGYNPVTQLTILANANNVQNLGTVSVASADDDDSYSDGLYSAIQAGANLNTEAIKKMQTDVMVNYQRITMIDRTRLTRMAVIDDEHNMLTNTQNEVSSLNNNFKAAFKIKNKVQDHFIFSFNPDFTYQFGDGTKHSSSGTDYDGKSTNVTISDKSSVFKKFDTSGDFKLGFSNLGNKPRSIILTLDYDIAGKDSQSTNRSVIQTAETKTDILHYDTDNNNRNYAASLKYVEPLSDAWKLSLTLNGAYKKKITDKAVRDDDGILLERYSGYSDNSYISTSGYLLAQWGNDLTNIQFGFKTAQREPYVAPPGRIRPIRNTYREYLSQTTIRAPFQYWAG